MKRFAKNLSVFLVTGVLAVPLTIGAYARAQDHETKERAEKAEKVEKAEKKLRVYDAKHSDYHDWDTNEDRAYRRYLSDRHEDYRDYGKLTHEKQTEYWEWRHENPDRDDSDKH